MPRQLPWKNKGGGSGSKTRTLPQKTAPKPRIQSDIDDDFFADTVLARDPRDSDDDFPELPHATPNARTSRKSKGKDPVEGSRLLSSSPPPAEELPPPEIEYMDKGVDKFDLRDDEWMMVEDELLQTAKLFTRHLHLAEYDRMKADIDEKKLRNEKTPRPVVPGAKPSIVGQFKKKAEKQSKVQKAFFDAEDESEEEESPVRHRPTITTSVPNQRSLQSRPPTVSVTNPRTNTAIRQKPNESGSDSDDLDAPKHLTVTKHEIPSKPPPKPTQKPLSKPAQPTPKLVPSPPEPTPSSSFVKPALPTLSNARARARARAAQMSRPNLLDSWDDFVPNGVSAAANTPSPPAVKEKSLLTHRSSSPVKAATPATKKADSSVNLWDNFNTPKRDTLSKETSDRLAKRKADKDKESRSKARKKDVDDIPTFMF